MPQAQFKDPVRNINQEYLQGLEVLSNKEYPLPGARCRGGNRDPRHTHLDSGTPEVILFNHIATIRHRPTGMWFVAFKKTMDALLLEQQDTSKYPTWLMDSKVKQTELTVHIHTILPPYSNNPMLVVKDPAIVDASGQTRVHKWLGEIASPWVFDTVAYYLLKNNVITQDMYGRIA
jgi:hypothetical protein